MDKVKWLNEYCHQCGEQLNSWDDKCSQALGFKKKHCEDCILKEYGQSKEYFRDAMESYFGMRPCFGI